MGGRSNADVQSARDMLGELDYVRGLWAVGWAWGFFYMRVCAEVLRRWGCSVGAWVFVVTVAVLTCAF